MQAHLPFLIFKGSIEDYEFFAVFFLEIIAGTFVAFFNLSVNSPEHMKPC